MKRSRKFSSECFNSVQLFYFITIDGGADCSSVISQLHQCGELFQQLGQRPPQGGIVPLQSGDLLGINPAVGVGLDCHLIEVV